MNRTYVYADKRMDWVCVMFNLVLQTAVLPLRVLPDDHDIDVFVASLDSWEGLAVHHVCEKVQACAIDAHRDKEKQKVTSHYQK